MNDNLRKTFEEQLTYLPAINQQALRSFDWATELIGIGKQYGLHIDQLDDLQIETMLVLVGVTSADDYPNELITRLAISPSEADKIIEQVNDRIFTPIHDYIVRGGPVALPDDTAIMANAGFQMATNPLLENQPVVSNNRPIAASNPTPIINQPVITPTIVSTPVASPLTFNPQTTPTPVAIPTTVLPTNPSPVMSAREKLEKIYQDRKKVIDATLQSMDQQKPMA
jgi:hypothetical protein